MPTNAFHVCDTCGPAIVNADLSAFTDDDELATVTAFIESVRDYLVPTGEVDPGGYWSCESCGGVNIGSAIVLETLA